MGCIPRLAAEEVVAVVVGNSPAAANRTAVGRNAEAVDGAVVDCVTDREEESPVKARSLSPPRTH